MKHWIWLFALVGCASATEDTQPTDGPAVSETSQESNVPTEERCNATCWEELVEPGVTKMKCKNLNHEPWDGIHAVTRCSNVARWYAENEGLGDKDIEVNRCKWVTDITGKSFWHCQKWKSGYIKIDKVFANKVHLTPKSSDNQRRTTSLQLIGAEMQWPEPTKCDVGRLDLSFTWPACKPDGTNDGKLTVGGTFANCYKNNKSIPQAAHVKGELPSWIDTGTNSREKWACFAAIAAGAATIAAVPAAGTPAAPAALAIVGAGLAVTAGAATDCLGYLDGDGRTINKVVPVTNFAGNPLDGVAGEVKNLKVNGFSNGPNFGPLAINVDTKDIHGPGGLTGTNKEDPVEICARKVTMRWNYSQRARLKFYKPDRVKGTGYVEDFDGKYFYEDMGSTWHFFTDTPAITVDADEPCLVNKAKYDAALAAAATPADKAEIEAYAGRTHHYGALDVKTMIAEKKALAASFAACAPNGCVTGSGKYDGGGQIETLTDGVTKCPAPPPPPPPPPPGPPQPCDADTIGPNAIGCVETTPE